MAGAPRSRRCSNCRTAKKGCDEAKPACGRCTRLGLLCVGSGVRPWKFVPFDQRTAASPKAGPSNEMTRTTSCLASLLGIKDIRYDLRHLGGPYCIEQLRRAGSNTALDASLSALVASYRATQCNQPRVEALNRYGAAMRALRISLQDSTQPIMARMFAVINISLCQAWIDLKQEETSVHREVMAHLVQTAVLEKKLGELRPEFILGLCQIITWESMVNPRVKLGRWFWEALRACKGVSSQPYVDRQGERLPSSDVGIHATASLCLRAPERHLEQLRDIYKLILQDRPMVHQIIMQWTAAANMDSMLRVSSKFGYRFGYGLLISLGPRINRCLRRFDSNPVLVTESYEFCDQAIEVGRRCLGLRPFGSGFVPTYLKTVWASTPNQYRFDELRELMEEYEKDFQGVSYVEQAEWVRKQFDMLEGSQGCLDGPWNKYDIPLVNFN